MALVETQYARRGQEFLPLKVAASTPELYATEDVAAEDKVVTAHYFIANANWWMVELDLTEARAFGYCDLGMGFPEWGYFDLQELETLSLAGGFLIVERDEDFTPRTFAELQQAGRV